MDPGPWIPIFAIAVGGLAVLGRVVVQPIIHAVLKMNEQKAGIAPAELARLEQRLGAVEERLGGMEHSVESLVEDRDFYRQLSAGQRPPQ
jgi:hypothetical protein